MSDYERVLKQLGYLATGGGQNITYIREAIAEIEKLEQWQTDMLAWLKDLSFAMTRAESDALDDLLERAGVEIP